MAVEKPLLVISNYGRLWHMHRFPVRINNPELGKQATGRALGKIGRGLQSICGCRNNYAAPRVSRCIDNVSNCGDAIAFLSYAEPTRNQVVA